MLKGGTNSRNADIDYLCALIHYFTFWSIVILVFRNAKIREAIPRTTARKDLEFVAYVSKIGGANLNSDLHPHPTNIDKLMKINSTILCALQSRINTKYDCFQLMSVVAILHLRTILTSVWQGRLRAHVLQKSVLVMITFARYKLGIKLMIQSRI